MITQLLPEDVARNWELIKSAIMSALPPFAKDSPDKANNILEAILLNQLTVWVKHEVSEGEPVIQSIWTTSVITDSESQTQNLLIYSITNLDHTVDSDWFVGCEAMKEYAKSKNCANIVGFTDSTILVDWVKKLGGTYSFFIKIPI